MKKRSVKEEFTKGIWAKNPLFEILFSDLTQHCEAICKFGESKNTLKKLLR